MSLPCTIEELISTVSYVSEVRINRMNEFRIELWATHFYPEDLKKLESMGWIIEDPMGVHTFAQTESEPEQKLMRVTLVTKHWKRSNCIRNCLRQRDHDIWSIMKREVVDKIEKLRRERSTFYVPRD